MSTSPYAYVTNDTINFYDALGLLKRPEGIFSDEVWAMVEWAWTNTIDDGTVHTYTGEEAAQGAKVGGHWEKDTYKKISGGLSGWGRNSSGHLSIGKRLRRFFNFNNWKYTVNTYSESVWIWDSEESTGWDEETDINFRTIPDDVRDLLLKKVRHAMQMEFRHFVWTESHKGEHYNDGIREHGDYIENETFSPVNFNTRIHFKPGALTTNEYLRKVTLNVTDYHYKIPATMIYKPYGYEESNYVYDVYWIEEAYGVNRQDGQRVFGYQIDFLNKNGMSVVKLILRQKDFNFLIYYMTGGNVNPKYRKP